MKTHPKTVTPIIPNITDVPSDCLSSKPEPVPYASGTTPRMNASDVITIGLRRFCAAVLTAETIFSPRSSRCFANSTIRIAFLHASPMRTTKPICVMRLLSSPLMLTPIIANSITSGTTSMTDSGSVQLS